MLPRVEPGERAHLRRQELRDEGHVVIALDHLEDPIDRVAASRPVPSRALLVVGFVGNALDLAEDGPTDVVRVELERVRLRDRCVEPLVLDEVGAVEEQPLEDRVVRPRRHPLVDDLRLHLRCEVALLLAHDPDHVALPVLEPARVAHEEPEEVGLRLTGKSDPGGVALRLGRTTALGRLLREEVVVPAPRERGRLRLEPVAELGQREGRRERLAVVDEVLDDLAADVGHVPLDPLGGGPNAREEALVRRLEVPTLLEHHGVTEHVRDHEELRDECVAVEQVGVRGPGVDHELVDARATGVVVCLHLLVGLPEAPVGVAAREPARGDVVHDLRRDEVESHRRRSQPQRLRLGEAEHPRARRGRRRCSAACARGRRGRRASCPHRLGEALAGEDGLQRRPDLPIVGGTRDHEAVEPGGLERCREPRRERPRLDGRDLEVADEARDSGGAPRSGRGSWDCPSRGCRRRRRGARRRSTRTRGSARAGSSARDGTPRRRSSLPTPSARRTPSRRARTPRSCDRRRPPRRACTAVGGTRPSSSRRGGRSASRARPSTPRRPSCRRRLPASGAAEPAGTTGSGGRPSRSHRDAPIRAWHCAGGSGASSPSCPGAARSGRRRRTGCPRR